MSRRLCVVHVNTERTWRGGEGQTLALAQGLHARGQRSIVVAQPNSPLAVRSGQAGLEVFPVAMRGEADLLAVYKLRRVFRTVRPDIVHLHTSHAHTLGALASWSAGFGLRIVTRRVDFSIYRHKWSMSGFKYRHGIHRFIAISSAVRDAMLADGIARERIRLVRSGVDPKRCLGGDEAVARRELGLPSGARLVGSVAHFGWHKSLETLIDAAEALVRAEPAVHIVLVGDGDQRDKLERHRSASGVADQIHFAGFRANVADYLAAFEVFVMPSVMEGLCTSILDAFAVGVPVVASRAGGMPELVEHEHTGLLVPPAMPADLAEAIVRLLRDADLRRQVVSNARLRLADEYTHDAMVEGNLRVYRELLQKSFERALGEGVE